MRFTLHLNPVTNQYWFKLINNAEDITFSSEDYATKDLCVEGVKEAILSLRKTDVSIEEEEGLFYMDILGDGSDSMARSTSFESREAAQQAIISIETEVDNQPEFEGSLTTVTETESPKTVRQLIYNMAPEGSVLTDFTPKGKGFAFTFFRAENDGKHFFYFQDRLNYNFLFGPEFTTGTRRDRQLGSVIKNAATASRYETFTDDNGSYYFTIKSRNGTELARSRFFANEGEMQELMTAFQAEAANWVVELEGIYKATKRSGKATTNVYNLTRASSSRTAGFESFKEGKEHYFHLNGIGGLALLFSEGYKSGSGRDNGIRSVIKNLSLEDRYVVKEEKGQYYFTLLAGNRQEIARSRYFGTKEELEGWKAWMQEKVAIWADQYNVELPGAVVATDTERFSLNLGREGTVVTPPPPPPPPSPDPKDQEEDKAGGGFWSWFWPLLAGLLALLLLLSLLRGCNSGVSGGIVSDDDSYGADTVYVDKVVNKCNLDSIYPPNRVLQSCPFDINLQEELDWIHQNPGLHAGAFGYWIGSTEGQIANFLSGKGSENTRVFLMDKVLFPVNSPKLQKDAYTQIHNLAALMKNYPGAKIEYLGYIGPDETENYKGEFSDGYLTLSQLRARCIYKKLRNVGVEAARMSWTGNGTKQMLISDDCDQARKRVEIRVTR